MPAPLLLIITNSYDTTADLLVHQLGQDKVFRYNFDLWREYGLEITRGGFSISDPTGRTATAESVVKALWRKPRSRTKFEAVAWTDEDRYLDQEIWYALRELVNLLWLDGKIVLIEPFAEAHAGKFVQLRVAGRHFNVPDYQFRVNCKSALTDQKEVVVKSLTMEPVGPEQTRELIFTTRVRDQDLSPGHPWMVQQYIHADKDVTVAYVRGSLFAFELDRTTFRERTADWREVPNDWGPNDWVPHELSQTVKTGIVGFMAEMGLDFGRLDFLLSGDRYYFLEVNTNGEWGWLDSNDNCGLLAKILAEVSPDTARTPIPAPRLASVRRPGSDP